MPDPYRDNLGMHEVHCQALERELLEALERRDWHASIVLPNNCGEPDRRGRELRRLLRGGQARLPWWRRLWHGLRRDTYVELDRQLETERREKLLRMAAHPPRGGTGIQSRVQVLAQAELQRLDSQLAGLRIISDNSGPASSSSDGTGRTGPLRPFPQPPPARVVR